MHACVCVCVCAYVTVFAVVHAVERVVVGMCAVRHLCVFGYMYVCIYIYVCIYTYMYTCIYIVIYVYMYVSISMCIISVSATTMTTLSLYPVNERWGAGVETQKNVRGEIGGWGRVPFNEPYAHC